MLLQGMDLVQALDLAYDHQLVLLGQLDQSPIFEWRPRNSR